MKISCDIIKDLLPLYYDGVCSADSKAIIEAHLAQCADCRAELAEMGKELPVSSKEQNLLEAKVVKELSKKWKHSLTKSMLCGILVAFLINNIAWVYLWFINNTGNNIIPSMLWSIVNVVWLIVEIIYTKRLERPIYKNWRVWVCYLFLLIALFTLAIYMFTESMP